MGRGAKRYLAHVDDHGLTGCVLFDERLHPLLHGLRLPLDGAAGRRRAERRRRAGRVRARVRGRARARRDAPSSGIESYPEYPGLEHPMRILAPRARRPRHPGAIGADQDGYPGILGYQGPPLSEVDGRRGRAARDRRSRAMMVRKSEAEVELIRESARWCEHAHRLLQEYSRARRDRGGGEPAGRARGDARDARGARRRLRRPAVVVRRRVRRLPRPDRAAQRVGARGRAQHRVPGRATSSSPRRARRSGATTPSSSGR